MTEQQLALLDEIIGHLGAAKTQTIPSDDKIIANHIESALFLSELMRKLEGKS